MNTNKLKSDLTTLKLLLDDLNEKSYLATNMIYSMEERIADIEESFLMEPMEKIEWFEEMMEALN